MMGDPEKILAIFNKFVHKYSRLPTENDPDYLEMLRMSKYRVLAVPDVTPGKCGNCGASKEDGRKYVDIGLHIDWYGALFICSLCLQDIAEHAGLFNELTSALSIAEDQFDTIRCLQEQGEELRLTVVQTFKEFKEFYAGLNSLNMVNVSDNSSSNSSSLAADETAGSKSRTDSSESGIESTEQRTFKPSTGTGRENVSSLTDLLKL